MPHRAAFKFLNKKVVGDEKLLSCEETYENDKKTEDSHAAVNGKPENIEIVAMDEEISFFEIQHSDHRKKFKDDKDERIQIMIQDSDGNKSWHNIHTVILRVEEMHGNAGNIKSMTVRYYADDGNGKTQYINQNCGNTVEISEPRLRTLETYFRLWEYLGAFYIPKEERGTHNSLHFSKTPNFKLTDDLSEEHNMLLKEYVDNHWDSEKGLYKINVCQFIEMKEQNKIFLAQLEPSKPHPRKSPTGLPAILEDEEEKASDAGNKIRSRKKGIPPAPRKRRITKTDLSFHKDSMEKYGAPPSLGKGPKAPIRLPAVLPPKQPSMKGRTLPPKVTTSRRLAESSVMENALTMVLLLPLLLLLIVVFKRFSQSCSKNDEENNDQDDAEVHENIV